MFEVFDLEEAAVPAKCEGCGVQCELTHDLIRLLLSKHLANTAGERLVGDAGKDFDCLVDEHVPEEIADQIKTGFRKSLGNDIANLDEEIETTKQEIQANELACSGVFKMRATRGDVTYTVNVCTSPRIYVRDRSKPEHLPTHIQTTSASKQNK